MITELGFLPGSFSYKPFVVAANTIAIADADLSVYDLSDPTAPVELSAAAGLRGSVLARADGRLYLNSSVGDFHCVDISNLSAITPVWEAPYWHVRSVSVRGNLAVIARRDGFDDFLQIYDVVDNPSGPVAVSPRFPADESVYGALWDDDFVYSDRMHVYDVSAPATPRFLGAVSRPAAACIATTITS